MKTLALTTVALLVGGLAGTARAVGNNPLQPDYFWDKIQFQASPGSGSSAAVQVPTSPLTPSYFAARTVLPAFVGTGAQARHSYIDNLNAHNPLHPSYHRL